MTDRLDIRERFGWASSEGRRKLAADKLEIFEGRHRLTLAALVRSRMSDPGTAERVIGWTNTSRNLLRQIVNGEAFETPPTIDDPALPAAIAAAVR